MKFSTYIQSMYFWVTAILALIAIVVSIATGQFPTTLVVAVVASAALDILVKKLYLKKDFSFPQSAIITGLIIGSIAPLNSTILAILAAVTLASASKFIIRINRRHIFNPAAFGLLISLAAFSLPDQWWANAHYTIAGISIVLTPLLVFASGKADKLRIAVPLLIALAALLYFGGIYNIPSFTFTSIVDYLFMMPFFFAFVMTSEPMTTPFKHEQQIAFGIIMAFLVVALIGYNAKYALFISLLVGNLGFAVYSNYLAKYIGKGNISLGLGILIVVLLVALYLVSPFATSLRAGSGATTTQQQQVQMPRGLIDNGTLGQAVNDLNSLR